MSCSLPPIMACPIDFIKFGLQNSPHPVDGSKYSSVSIFPATAVNLYNFAA